MKLPKREFYTVHEVAARWGYTIADVAGWSVAGHFDILTGIQPAMEPMAMICPRLWRSSGRVLRVSSTGA